jgi:hypothetical protein
MDATLEIIKAAGAQLEYGVIEVGEKVYLSGNTSDIALESLVKQKLQKKYKMLGLKLLKMVFIPMIFLKKESVNKKWALKNLQKQ